MIPEDDHSTEFSPKPNVVDETDQRQLALLNDPNYGIVLCFLERFRSSLDLPLYSLQRLENHLVNHQERVPPRLIDFHFTLLKRLSLAKNTQREKFDTLITKFASRFDLNDGDHLTATGYLQAEISVKIRILKNLLESQFDLNQTFKNTFVEKAAREIKSTPLGRDRFGVSYWLFMDTDCFVRLFREDIDLDRSWSNVAKDREELENFIKILITDAVVRKKFSDWTIDYESFSSLSSSNEFEERYLPSAIDTEEDNAVSAGIEDEPAKKKRGRARRFLSYAEEQLATDIKEEPEPASTDDEQLCTPTKKKCGRSIVSANKAPEPVEAKQEDEDEASKKKRERGKSSTKPSSMETNPMNLEVKEEKHEVEQNATLHASTKRRSTRPRNSARLIEVKIKEEDAESALNGNEECDTFTKRRSGRAKKPSSKLTKQLETDFKEEEQEAGTSTRRGKKRKTPTEDNDKQQEETSADNATATVRRSSRPRKAPVLEPISIATSKTYPQVPNAKKKRSANGRSKAATDPSGTTKSARSRRRRKPASRRKFDDDFCLSSSGSDEHPDYVSEYESDDYLADPAEVEHDANFFELDEDNNITGEEMRTAKTAQASTIVTACRVCSKSDHPEVLLLCDDCDDAYHLECLGPRLLSVPEGDWFCPLCEHKKLSSCLIEKLKELLINFNLMETKRLERDAKRSLPRKLKTKEYSSDESVTASESEHEDLDDHLHGDESMLSVSQNNENSNISSSYFDDPNKNISQRGRHRRTRFDMNKMLNDDDGSDDNHSDTEEDDEYVEDPAPIMSFDVQIPKKMTRLFNQRYRPIARNDQPMRLKPIAPRFSHNTSVDLNEKLGSPIIYVNGDGQSHQIKSVITNSNQTLKIVRRWNDVQRRNRLRTNNLKLLNDTTSDCADETSVFCPDDASPPRSNDSNSNQDVKDDESTIIRSKITLAQPASLLPVYKSSNRNIVRKNEVNFDRLTRDIQYAVSEANTLSAMPKVTEQQTLQRVQKTNFSPYFTTAALRPLPVLLPKPTGAGYKIFKSKDPPGATSSTTSDLSNIILTPSSSSSLLDGNDDQSTAPMNT